jgi:hypothetical protein
MGSNRVALRRFDHYLKITLEAWQRVELTNVNAKVVVYVAFLEGRSRFRSIGPHRT